MPNDIYRYSYGTYSGVLALGEALCRLGKHGDTGATVSVPFQSLILDGGC